MASSSNTFVPVAGRGTHMGPPDYVASLPADKLNALRAWVRQASAMGGKPDQIDAALKAKYNVTAAQVMKTTPDDVLRSTAQGATFGFADELAGLGSAALGGSYTSTRDQIRSNQAQYHQAHPLADLGMQVLGGGAVALPVGVGAGVLRGAATGAASGTLQGIGSSNASTLGGIAGDAAIGGVAGTLLGGAFGGIAGKLASRGKAATEVATQVPLDPAKTIATMARQEELVPGTVVLADHMPDARRMLASIGADRKTAMLAREAQNARVQQIDQKLKDIGTYYETLKGVAKPVDKTLRTALQEAEITGLVKPGQRNVDLFKVNEVAKNLRRMARGSSDGGKAFKLNQAADQLTTWIEGHAPSVKEVNADYKLLIGVKDEAEETLKTITQSASNYAANRATGFESGSLGGSLPSTRHAGVGTLVNFVSKADRSARARALFQILLSPQQDATGFQTLQALRGQVVNPTTPTADALTNLFAGALVPKVTSEVNP